MLATFIRLTLLIAVGLVALVVLAVVLKLVLLAGLIAAVVVGALFFYNLIRRRSNLPIVRS